MNRSELSQMVWDLLGTTSADKFYLPATVERWLGIAHENILQRIRQTNPDYFTRTALITPASTGSRVYTLAAQTTPITNFAGVLELRLENDAGAELIEARAGELNGAAGGFYSITEPDESVVLTIAPSMETGLTLYLRYAYWPASMTQPSSIPNGIPAKYHALVGYEAARSCYSFGNEQECPSDIKTQCLDVDAALLLHVSHRSPDLFTQRGTPNVGGYLGSGL